MPDSIYLICFSFNLSQYSKKTSFKHHCHEVIGKIRRIALIHYDDDGDELFSGMADQQKAFSPTSSQDHCQGSSPS